MDLKTSYNLKIRIISSKSRARCFSINKVVDADITNFKYFVDEILDKYLCSYGDVAKVFYFYANSKTNIEISCDQELVQMFGKHKDTKCCLGLVVYFSPDSEPPSIPSWDSSTEGSVQIPCTPSLAAPSQIDPGQTSTSVTEPSNHCQHPNLHQTESYQFEEEGVDKYLVNPKPGNEHVGVDGEGLYIDIDMQQQPNVNRNADRDEDYHPGTDSESDSDCDDDYEVDDIVEDKVPSHITEVDYDKDDPPMSVGSIYPSMSIFRLALASHAIKHEFEYDIDKSGPGRYRVNYIGRLRAASGEFMPQQWVIMSQLR